MTLWFAWTHHLSAVDVIYSAVATLLCASWALALVSTLQVHRSLRNLGLSGTEAKTLFSGSRPTDPDELIAWKWGWRFMYGIIAALVCMMALPAISWLTSK
jgi:hypothetical protein